MRGLDTNVLLRYLTGDDPVQSPLAKNLIDDAEAESEKLFVTTIALCELVSTLRGSRYGLDRGRIGEALRLMLESAVFVLEDRDLVARAVEDYIAGSADFSDYLLGWKSRREGCRDIATFDRKLRSEQAFTLLEPNA